MESLAPQGPAQCCQFCPTTNICVPAEGGTGCIQVSAPVSCCWQTTVAGGVVGVTSGLSGCGNGEVCYEVPPYFGQLGTLHALQIGQEQFSIGQPRGGTPTNTTTPTPTPTPGHCVQEVQPGSGTPCCAGCSPANVCVSPAGAEGCFTVVAPETCCWRAASESFLYLSVLSGADGCGNGEVCYRASANDSTSGRIGAIAVDDQVFRVGQDRYPTPDGKADLVVDHAHISIPGFTGGCWSGGPTSLSLHVCIRNQGTRAAGPFDVEVNGQFFDRVSNIDQGAIVCALGPYTYPDDTTVRLDTANEVPESSEANNEWTQFVPIPTLPATCTPTPPVDVTPSPPTNTPVPGECPGDCNNDGRVVINELVLGVNIVLERVGRERCPAYGSCASGRVCIASLVDGVGSALHGCP